jgi:hypothetical protein
VRFSPIDGSIAPPDADPALVARVWEAAHYCGLVMYYRQVSDRDDMPDLEAKLANDGPFIKYVEANPIEDAETFKLILAHAGAFRTQPSHTVESGEPCAKVPRLE